MTARAYREAACEAARRALAEDLAGYGDITGAAFAGPGAARVVAREAGVLSGAAALEATAALVDPRLEVERAIAEHAAVEPDPVKVDMTGVDKDAVLEAGIHRQFPGGPRVEDDLSAQQRGLGVHRRRRLVEAADQDAGARTCHVQLVGGVVLELPHEVLARVG